VNVGIFGASGLIGRAVSARLRERGHGVIGFARNPEQKGEGWRRFDLRETPDISGCDAIVNLVGESVAALWTASKRRAILDSRVMSTGRIVEAIRAGTSPVTVLVNGSAIGIYGSPGEESVDETSRYGAGFLADVCEAWEAEALPARELGVRVVLLRTGVVLSPEGGALAAMLPVFRLGLGGKLGNGRQWMSWIHIADEAALICEAIENPKLDGPINGTAPSPVRNAEFTTALAQQLKRPAFFAVPGFALKAALNGFSGELLGSRRILPAAASRAGFTFQFLEVGVALADLLGK
jgi:uncharacterized protein